MKVPQLNRKLVLEAPERTPDGAGGYTIEWTALGTVWGAFKPGSGRETAAVGATLSRANYKIILRAAPVGQSLRPQPDQRLRDGVRAFLIQAVTEHDRAGLYLVCHAIEEVVA